MAFGTKLIDTGGTIIAALKAKFDGTATEGVLQTSHYPAYLGSTDGAYKLGLVSGTVAAGMAANSDIFHMRWTSSTKRAAIRSVMLSATVAGTAFAAGAPQFNLFFARGWTVDGSGGTGATLTGNNAKNRTDFATTSLGSLRIASTGALTAGTKTLDTNPLAAVVAFTGTATTGVIVPAGTLLHKRDDASEYPIMLEASEGLCIRASVPATGTWAVAVSVEWSEFDLANF